jgi:ElaB/YqjD/DUF883 family membrane-anchored ribosome-binding protein
MPLQMTRIKANSYSKPASRPAVEVGRGVLDKFLAIPQNEILLLKQSNNQKPVKDLTNDVDKILQKVEDLLEKKLAERLSEIKKIGKRSSQKGVVGYRKNRGVVYLRSNIQKALEPLRKPNESLTDAVNRILSEYLTNTETQRGE